MEQTIGSVYIGPAGWSYEDWNGVVYPADKPRRFDPLEYLTSYFNLIEINSTFYRVPEPKTAESWVNRVSARSDFVFTAKLHQSFTHTPAPVDPREITVYKRALSPLLENNRLGGILIQFPWSFRHCNDSCRRIRALVDQLHPFPTSVEVRHGSWAGGPARKFFGDHGITACGVDQPVIGESLTPDYFVRGGMGSYFRLHGRNELNWFKPNAGRDARYDYDYTARELEPWAQRATTEAAAGTTVYAVLNNHFRGQAPANALELKSLLKRERVPVPVPLKRAFPRLAEVAAGGEDLGPLFDRR